MLVEGIRMVGGHNIGVRWRIRVLVGCQVGDKSGEGGQWVGGGWRVKVGAGGG